MFDVKPDSSRKVSQKIPTSPPLLLTATGRQRTGHSANNPKVIDARVKPGFSSNTAKSLFVTADSGKC
jgi:hypothetical protein